LFLTKRKTEKDSFYVKEIINQKDIYYNKNERFTWKNIYLPKGLFS